MFRYMKYVKAVYAAGSFSAAAKDLYVSQPCLSAMIKKTEDQLGVKIFDRKTKPLQLTEYGKQYFEYLDKIERLENDFERQLNDLRGLHTGTLSIGSNNVFASYVLPPLIREFNKKYPGVQVNMVEGNIQYLSHALENSKLDLVLDNCHLDAETFNQHQLKQEHLLLAVHKSIHDNYTFKECCLGYSDILNGKHLDKKIGTVSIKEFADLPFIILRPGNDTRTRMDTICSQTDLSIKVQLEVDQLATAYNIACNRLGITLVSDTLLFNATPNSDMCYYKISSDATLRDIYIYNKRKQYTTAAMNAFLQTAKEYFENSK